MGVVRTRPLLLTHTIPHMCFVRMGPRLPTARFPPVNIPCCVALVAATMLKEWLPNWAAVEPGLSRTLHRTPGKVNYLEICHFRAGKWVSFSSLIANLCLQEPYWSGTVCSSRQGGLNCRLTQICMFRSVRVTHLCLMPSSINTPQLTGVAN